MGNDRQQLFKEAQEGFQAPEQAGAPAGPYREQLAAEVQATPQQAQPGGAPGMMPQAKQWIGPRTSVFKSSMSLVPTDPVQLQSFVMNDITRKHPFLSKYPSEVEILQEEDQNKFGEVILANEMGTSVSIPFVIKDGKLKPFVVVAIDGEMYALGDEQSFIELMESPVPTGAVGAPNAGAGAPNPSPADATTAQQEMQSQGPDQENPNSYRRSMLDGLTKESSLVTALKDTGVSAKLFQLLEIQPDVVQYERVPFGVLRKEASADCFEPLQIKLSLDEVPHEIFDLFDRNPFVTERLKVASDDTEKKSTYVAIDDKKEVVEDSDGKKREFVYPVQVTDLIDYDKSYKQSKKAEPKKGLPPFGMSLLLDGGEVKQFKVLPFLDLSSVKKAESGDMDAVPSCSSGEGWIALSAEGDWATIKRYTEYQGRALPTVPSVGSDVSEAFKTGGGYGAFIVPAPPGKDYYDRGGSKFVAIGPVEFTKAKRAIVQGELMDIVMSSEVKSLAKNRHAMGCTLYLPSATKFAPMKKQVTPKVIDRDEVIGDMVYIQKQANMMVSLRGKAVNNAKWGDEKIAELPLSFRDASFVLGAAGVDEDTALAKIAEAYSEGEARVRSFATLSAPSEVEVHLGFLKFAAAIPAQADRFLAVQMLGDRTLGKILNNLPDLKNFADDIAVITLAAQMGFGDVEETVAFQALRNLQELVTQLESVRIERGLDSNQVTAQ